MVRSVVRPGSNVHFDERIASRYDVLWADLFDPAVVDPAVDFLADLAGTGAGLELGIGTGQLEPRALCERQPEPRLSVGKGRIAL